jgi:Ca2+-binding EF-hand superfamily protein
MCNCENMANPIRDEKITEFFQSVIKSHMDEEGKVTYDKLGKILTSLGRKISGERILKIKKKFGVEDSDMIDWEDPDFIMTVASLNVVDVKAIADGVFSKAFKIFDMVTYFVLVKNEYKCIQTVSI